MRRFVTLFVLLFVSVPFGITIAGCGKQQSAVFCTGSSGPILGQLFSLTIGPANFGISLNAGEFGQAPTAAAVDCKGTSVTAANVTYGLRGDTRGLTDPTRGLVDIVPSGISVGRLCAGTWNRNTGGGIPDYTVCTPATSSGTVYVVASSGGVSSNALPIFVHPVVSTIVVGPPSTDCKNDTATNCCAFSTTGGATAPTANAVYDGNSCLSRNTTGQLAARVFTGSGQSTTNNITCRQTGVDAGNNPVYAPLVGHVTFSAADNNIVTIDENGIATAKFPGSTIVNASVATASSTNGFFSTCAPASIVLSLPGAAAPPTTPVTLNQNNTLPVVATVIDSKGTAINGISLDFVSTTPTTLPSGGAGTVTPLFPGSGAITAVCLPPTCNNSPLSEIGLFGNGLPIVSNQIVFQTPGMTSSVLYAASTDSFNLVAIDFLTNRVGSPVRLPFVPNSMVISNDGARLFLGSATELILVSASTTAVTQEFPTIPGTVLAISPDNATLVVTDPARNTTSLVTSSGVIATTTGGTGTRAQFSPDSGTVYVSAGNQLLVHSSFSGWSTLPLNTPATDVSVATPAVGAFLGGITEAARGYCPITTISGSGSTATTSNQFYPDAGLAGPSAERIAATNDGNHLLGATVTPRPTFTDLAVTHPGPGGVPAPGVPTSACPPAGSQPGALQFGGTLAFSSTLPGVNATAITRVTAASDSSIAFVTYQGSGGVLPAYTPAATGPGTLASIALSGAATAPVSGVFSADNNTFFTGTAGDNLVHLVTRGSAGYSDTSTVDPKLGQQGGSGSAAPNLLAQRPRRTS